MQHFKILQIVLRPKKLIKANYKPSKMDILKYTFQQSFKLHLYWWELKKKKANKPHTYLRVHINTHTHKHIRTSKHIHTRTHAHIDYRPNYIIIYT